MAATNCRMLRGKKRWLLAACAMLLTACDLGPSNPDTEMYVRVPTREASTFTSILASVLKEKGLSASTGRTTEPAPATTYVLEAKSWAVRVWAQNAVLDPQAGLACGYPSEVSGERSQYLVSVQRRWPLAAQRARETFAELRKSFEQRGYTVAQRQMPCEPLSKTVGT
jgi:hypothetical protein